MNKAFISYVRENIEMVDRLCQELKSHGIEVWLDRNDIDPGSRWEQAIRKAIHQGTFFIACFSEEYNNRDKTYMNEELTLAIEELRQRPTDRIWFIPVKLNDCEIPNRDIGAGKTLQTFYYVELYEDWDSSIQRILKVIQPASSEPINASTSEQPINQNVEAEYNRGEFALLRPEDGRLHFVPFRNSSWDSTEISLEFIPESSEQTAFLRSLRENLSNRFAGEYRFAFALGEDATWVSPRDIAQTTSDSQTVWEVVLGKSSSEQNVNFFDSTTFNGISPDQFAQMRTRRLLLNDKQTAINPLSNTVNQLNQATLEMYIRGEDASQHGTRLQVLESPIPYIYRSYGQTVWRFQKFARLASVLYLKLSNTVEDVLQLDLELLNQQQLQVRFKGRRPRQYTNVDPYMIEVEGICPLSE